MISDEYHFSDEEKGFVKDHLHHDPAALMLSHAHDPRKRKLVAQVKARQQIRKKLPEWYKNQQLVMPTGLPLEQASSEDTAKLKSSLIRGKHLLDITGGLGIDTFYLSRSFDKATYVEKNSELTSIAAHNFSMLGANIEVKTDDGIAELQRSNADVVYIDPHRRDGIQKVVALQDCEPNVTDIHGLISEGQTTLIKASPMLDISRALQDLQSCCEVWVISVRNECKEVVFVLRSSRQDYTEIKTFNITPSATEQFSFRKGGETSSPQLSDPQNFLYEPNASIMKAGGQDVLARKFDLNKLHPHSHLYTSQDLLPGFPGKSFRIKEILKPWDKSLRSQKLNVISRNFPAKANVIEKKLRLSPSDNSFLIATKLSKGNLKFIVGELLPSAQ